MAGVAPSREHVVGLEPHTAVEHRLRAVSRFAAVRRVADAHAGYLKLALVDRVRQVEKFAGAECHSILWIIDDRENINDEMMSSGFC